MYEYESRVRYSELDENGRIRLLSLLNYLQDASTFHGVDCGMTTQHFKEIHRAWFINYWDIRIDRLPADGERIRIGTSSLPCSKVNFLPARSKDLRFS